MPKFTVELGRKFRDDFGRVTVEAVNEADAEALAMDIAKGRVNGSAVEWEDEIEDVVEIYIAEILNLEPVDYAQQMGCAIERAFGDGNDLGG